MAVHTYTLLHWKHDEFHRIAPRLSTTDGVTIQYLSHRLSCGSVHDDPQRSIATLVVRYNL